MASFQKVAVIGTFAALQGCGGDEPETQTVQADGSKTILTDAAVDVQEVMTATSNYLKTRKIRNVQELKDAFNAATNSLSKDHKAKVNEVVKKFDDSIKEIVNKDVVQDLPQTFTAALDTFQKEITDAKNQEMIKEQVQAGLQTFQSMWDEVITPQPTTEQNVQTLTDFAEKGLVAEKKAEIIAAFESYGALDESQREKVDKKIESLKKSTFRGMMPCNGEEHKHSDVEAFRAKVIDAKNPDIIKVQPLKKFLPFGYPKGATAEAQEIIIQEVSIMLRQAHAQSTDLTEEECEKYVSYVKDVRTTLKIGKAEVKPAEAAVTKGKKENAKKEKKEKKVQEKKEQK